MKGDSSKSKIPEDFLRCQMVTKRCLAMLCIRCCETSCPQGYMQLEKFRTLVVHFQKEEGQGR